MMAITVMPGSAKLVLVRRPRANRPEIVQAPDQFPQMSFSCTDITVSGQVWLTGGAGEHADGWTLGFIQAMWIDTRWFYYRGRFNNDGSMLLNPGLKQACRDIVEGSVDDVFYDINATATPPQGAGLPVRLFARFNDFPFTNLNLVEFNTTTRKPNYLAEAQIEAHFCTVFSLRDPRRVFHHLLHFYWNVRWQARFWPLSFPQHAFPDFRIDPVDKGTGAAIGPFIPGGPADLRFSRVLTSHAAFSCNEMLSDAGSGKRRESPTWRDFDVR